MTRRPQVPEPILEAALRLLPEVPGVSPTAEQLYDLVMVLELAAASHPDTSQPSERSRS